MPNVGALLVLHLEGVVLRDKDREDMVEEEEGWGEEGEGAVSQ
ncbi:MAG: hypothetical protein AAB545_00230 [Patescibacteria group bacterium]